MIVATNIAIGCWLIIALGFETAKHNPLKVILGHWRINRFLSWVGLWFSWSMFAPVPLHSNRNVFCRAVDKDGRELAIWTEPDWNVMLNGKEPPPNASTWFMIKRWFVSKWHMFDEMRLRKLFSSCGEARQWDMPILLRQICRCCERHMNRQGIYPHSIAMFIDLEYSPYYCPRDGVKEWKTANDSHDQVLYVFEAENTTEENETISDGQIIHIPYSVKWEWKRRTPANGGEEGWLKTLLDDDGNRWVADTADVQEQHVEDVTSNSDNQFTEEDLETPKETRNMGSSYEKREIDNEFLDSDQEVEHEEFIIEPDNTEPHLPRQHEEDSVGR